MSNRANYLTLAADGVSGLMVVHSYLKTTELGPYLTDLAFLRVSQINGCAYCIDMHTQDLNRQGVAWEKLVLVSAWREAGEVFSEREKAALAWVESVTNVAITGVPDSDYDAAAAHFSGKELADLAMAVALMSAFNRLSVAFRNKPVAATRLLKSGSADGT